MNGRTFSLKFRGVIRFLKRGCRVLPKSFCRWLLTHINGETKLSVFTRYLLFSRLCFECGDNVYIGRNVTLKNIQKISVGSNVSIHTMCYLDGLGGITIGDNVSIAHGVSIVSFDHTYIDLSTPIKYNSIEAKPIVIGNDVWIGCGARILSGVNIGERCVIGAQAVVKSDIPNGSLSVGIPAKVIKNILPPPPCNSLNNSVLSFCDVMEAQCA